MNRKYEFVEPETKLVVSAPKADEAVFEMRCTAPYTRGVALCQPLTRLASVPLARPEDGNNLVCASRSSACCSQLHQITLIMFALCCFAILPAVNAEQGDQKNSAPKKANISLKQLDEAKSWKDWNSVLNNMEPVTKENRSVLQSYVDDTKHDGQKRFMVFRTLFNAASGEEKRNAINERLQSEKDVDFRVSLMQEMGRDKSGIFKKQLSDVSKNEKEHSFVRVSAGLAMAVRGDFSGKALALKSVKEASPYKDFAMQTLAVMKAIDVIPELSSEMTSVTDYSKKNSCRLGILRVELSVAVPSQQVGILSKAINEDGYFEVAQWATKRLAEIGGSETSQLFVSLVKGGKFPGRQFGHDGLMLGVENGHWTKEDVLIWLKK